MRLALGQAPHAGSIDGNVAEAADLVRQAGAAGADLLLLHELALCGYDLEAIAADPGLAVTVDDARLRPLQDACAATGTAVLVGAAVRDEESLANALLLVGTDGSSEVAYRKIHLWEDEAMVFRRGDRLRVLTIAELRVGVAICYDAGFPEVTRHYGRADVDLVVFGSAFMEGDQEHRYDIYHPARALENGVFLAVANAVGPHGGDVMFGRSQLFGPQGHLLAELGDGRGLATYDIAAGQARTERLPYLQHLRTIPTPDERTTA